MLFGLKLLFKTCCLLRLLQNLLEAPSSRGGDAEVAETPAQHGLRVLAAAGLRPRPLRREEERERTSLCGGSGGVG